ncbi:hypothetical protein L1887_53650 [Cichorium endivia]|nr:hypothetical protein L1887_53650 [Cichorium endivia]
MREKVREPGTETGARRGESVRKVCRMRRGSSYRGRERSMIKVGLKARVFKPGRRSCSLPEPPKSFFLVFGLASAGDAGSSVSSLSDARRSAAAAAEISRCTGDVRLVGAVVAVHKGFPADTLAAHPALGECVGKHDSGREQARVGASVLVARARHRLLSRCCDRGWSARAVLDERESMANRNGFDHAGADRSDGGERHGRVRTVGACGHERLHGRCVGRASARRDEERRVALTQRTNRERGCAFVEHGQRRMSLGHLGGAHDRGAVVALGVVGVVEQSRLGFLANALGGGAGRGEPAAVDAGKPLGGIVAPPWVAVARDLEGARVGALDGAGRPGIVGVDADLFERGERLLDLVAAVVRAGMGAAAELEGAVEAWEAWRSDALELGAHDGPGWWRLGRFRWRSVEGELDEGGRAAFGSHFAHLVCVEAKAGHGALESVRVDEVSRGDLGKDDAEGEYVGGEAKVYAEEDLGRHVAVGAAVADSAHLVFVACGDAGKAKVADLDSLVCGDEEVLALEVAMHAVACVEVGERSGHVHGEAHAEAPREGLGVICDVGADVATDEFRDDVDPAVEAWTLYDAEAATADADPVAAVGAGEVGKVDDIEPVHGWRVARVGGGGLGEATGVNGSASSMVLSLRVLDAGIEDGGDGKYVYVVEMRRMEGRDVKMPDGPVMMERVLTIVLGETGCGEGKAKEGGRRKEEARKDGIDVCRRLGQGCGSTRAARWTTWGTGLDERDGGGMRRPTGGGAEWC